MSTTGSPSSIDPTSGKKLHSRPAQLRTSLRVALENPTIAQWLFSERDVPFRSSHDIISPSLFQDAMNFSIFSVFGSPEGGGATRPPDSPEDAERPQLDSSLFMSLIPARVIDGFVLGYSYNVGCPIDPTVLDLRCALHSSFGQTTRFLFDGNSRHLLVYMPFCGKGRDLIATMDWIDSRHRQIVYISTPARQYSFHDPPTEVLSITVQDDFLVEPAEMVTSVSRPQMRNAVASTNRSNPPSPSARVDEADLHIAPVVDDLNEFSDGTPSQRSVMSTAYSSSSSLGGGYPRLDVEMERALPILSSETDSYGELWLSAPQPLDTELPALDLSPMGLWMEQINEHMSGKFRGPLRTEAFGETSFSGLVNTKSTPADTEEHEMLRIFSARSYYAATLAVSVDQALLTSNNETLAKEDGLEKENRDKG